MEPGPSTDRTCSPRRRHKRRGVVGVVIRNSQLLVIQRSHSVPAPGRYCFPGGGVERGETEEQALIREMSEEVLLEVDPLQRLWENRTRSGVKLGWWLVNRSGDAEPRANPQEVAKILWLPVSDILRLDGLLETNRQFFNAWKRGLFKLPLPPP